jgi:hypothetical protein
MPMGVDDGARLPSTEEMHTPSSSPATVGIIKQARTAAEKLAVVMRRHKKKSLATLLTVVYLTGTFGSVSLPPSYGKVAMKPISDYHNAFVVACPLWHGTEALSSWTYVDDTIDVTADWGLRRWVSRHTLMEGFFAFLGVNAFNVSKASSGYATDLIGWGLGLNTVSERSYYSAPRVKRLRDKVWDVEFDRDYTGEVSYKKLASLHGSMRNMQAALRCVRAHYRAVSRMLATADPCRCTVRPRGDAQTVKLAWARFHDAVDQLRILADDDAFWSSGYLSSFAGMLSPAERLNTPGENSRRVFWGSDATPWVLMVTDHQAREVAVLHWTDELEEILRASLIASGVPPGALIAAIISIKELAAPVLGTCLWGHRSPDQMIICPVDNQTACRWCAKLEADNEMAVGLLNVLARQCARNHNELVTPYINTERNEFADMPTRPDKLLPPDRREVASYEEVMAAYGTYLERHHPGYKLVDMAPIAKHYFSEIGVRLSTRLHDEPAECAAAKVARMKCGSPPAPPTADSVQMVTAECAAAEVARMKRKSPPAPPTADDVQNGSVPSRGLTPAGTPPAEERAGGDVGIGAASAAELGITMIEGCGGCGQVTAAAKARGVNVLKGVESDPIPRAVWRLRFGEDAELDHDVLSASTWRGLTPEQKRGVTAIFGGWPCPAFSQANPDARGGEDARAWLFYFVIHVVLSDNDYNYQRQGKLLSLSGENVVGKEEWREGIMVAREGELAGSLGYVRSSVRVLGSLLNDGQARLRLIEVYEPWQLVAALQPLALHLPAGHAPQRMCALVLPPEQRPPGHWIENWNDWHFERDDGPETDGSKPRRAGYVYGGGRMHHCWHDDGVSWTVKASGELPKGSGGAFYLCSKTGKVYVLAAEDTWRLQGIPNERPPRPTSPSGVWLEMPSREARPSASSTTSSSAAKFNGIRQSRRLQNSAWRAGSSQNGTGAAARRGQWQGRGRSAHGTAGRRAKSSGNRGACHSSRPGSSA